MAVRADITKDFLWFYLERKTVVITCTDDQVPPQPINLSAVTLKWRITREQGSSIVYLTKNTGSGIIVTGAGNNVVNITIDPDANDYTLLKPGRHWHELFDLNNDALLSYGDVYIHRSLGP